MCLEAEWSYLASPTFPGQFLAVFELGEGYTLKFTGWPQPDTPLPLRGVAAFYDADGEILNPRGGYWSAFAAANEPALQSTDALKPLRGHWASTFCTIAAGAQGTEETTLEFDFSTNRVDGLLGGVPFSSLVKYDETRLRYYGDARFTFAVYRDEGPLLFSGSYSVEGEAIYGEIAPLSQPDLNYGMWRAIKTLK